MRPSARLPWLKEHPRYARAGAGTGFPPLRKLVTSKKPEVTNSASLPSADPRYAFVLPQKPMATRFARASWPGGQGITDTHRSGGKLRPGVFVGMFFDGGVI